MNRASLIKLRMENIMKNKLLITSAVVVSTAAVIGLANTKDASASKKEKCYGVVKAGKNDCAAKDGSHSCAGLAKVDHGSNEWVLLPDGVCDKLAGGVKS